MTTSNLIYRKSELLLLVYLYTNAKKVV